MWPPFWLAMSLSSCLMVIFMQSWRVTLAHRAVLDVIVNAPVLVGEEVIYLRPQRVIFLPGCCSRRGARNPASRHEHGRNPQKLST
jgi:hypothetical protein